MKILAASFKGEVPRVTPRLLPESAAQVALDCRLLSGDLGAWGGPGLVKAGNFSTIYLLNGVWLTFPGEVDVARGVIPGDNTFRFYMTSPGLYATPRWSNFEMATSGAEPYPVLTRPIGVPGPEVSPALVIGVDPTATTFAIDTLDAGDELAKSWTVSAPRGGATTSLITQGAGVYLCQYDEIHNAGEQPNAFRNFGCKSAAVVEFSADVQFLDDVSFFQAVLNVKCDIAGAGVQVNYDSINGLAVCQASAWSVFGSGVLSAVASPAMVGGHTYKLTCKITGNTDGTSDVTATILDGAAVLATVHATGTFPFGDYCGFSNAITLDSPTVFSTTYTNLHLIASGSTNYTPVNIATSYVFTYKNDIGEESAPSLPSKTILRPDGIAVTVTTPTDAPAAGLGYAITTKAIYRAVTGATGTVYVFVAEIPLAQADYEDKLDDDEVASNNVLESDEWDLPPADLQGIMALPNGIMAGFRRNQLCFSAAGRPHAWPVRYRLNVDTDIVAIANIDTTVVIGTKAFPYLALGSDPAAYSMTKLESSQACVSKPSMTALLGLGVVYASPDGLMAVAGSGSVRNLTANLFTRDQWQARVPAEMRGVVHDDIYWFKHRLLAGTAVEFSALDMKQDGFGLIRLSFVPDHFFADPLTDALYMTTFGGTPGIYRFNVDPHVRTPYTWRGKLNLLHDPTVFLYCQLRGDFVNDVGTSFPTRVRLYGNVQGGINGESVLILDRVVSSEDVFTLPSLLDYDQMVMELSGSAAVRTLCVAESVEELD